MSEHQSDSAVQREAEQAIREQLAAKLGKPLEKMRVALDDEVGVEVDAVDPSESVFAEIFARIGQLKPGQKRKVVADAFKLVTLARTRPGGDLFLVFVDEEAAAFARGKGWFAHSLAVWGIGVEVIEIDEALRAELLAVQGRQFMGNQDKPETEV